MHRINTKWMRTWPVKEKPLERIVSHGREFHYLDAAIENAISPIPTKCTSNVDSGVGSIQQILMLGQALMGDDGLSDIPVPGYLAI